MNKLFQVRIIGIAFAISMFLVPSFFVSCVSSRNKNDVAKVKLVFNLPIIKAEGEVMNITDSVYIFNQRGSVVLKFSYFDIRMENDRIVSEKRKLNYFAYDKDKTYGLFYDPDSTVVKIYAVDSMLKSKIFGGATFFVFNEFKLVYKNDQDGQSGTEHYVPKVKRDESYPDSVTLFYSSRFRDIDFSLSKFMDSLRHSKLCKISLRFNKGSYPGVAVEVPQREIMFELKNVSDQESTEIGSMFDRFNRDKRKLLLDTVPLAK